MYDVITIGSSLIDIFITSDEFKLKNSAEGVLLCEVYGDKIAVDEFALRTGGGGSNTAVGLSRLGFKVGVVTETGKDAWSQILLDDFHSEYVATNLLIAEKKEQTGGSVILLGTDGGRTVLVHRGASSMLDPKDIPQPNLQHVRWIHLASISGREDTLKTIFTAKRQGSTGLSWNPGKRELQLLVEKKIHLEKHDCQILLVNKQEWDILRPLQLQLSETIEQIVITDGKRGGEVKVAGSSFSYDSSHANRVVDETGAGDAFACGYVAAHLHNMQPREAVEWGKSNAQSVIQHLGAKPGLLRKREII